FSRCLALQCAEVHARLGAGAILELGAGSGAMAAVLLRELERLGSLPERYLILEVSAELRERQQRSLEARVPELARRVAWLDRLPRGFTGTVLANEVLDALPFERFAVRGGALRRLGVTWRSARLDWAEGPATAALENAVRRIELQRGKRFPEGYVSELNLRLPCWFAAIGEAVAAGVLLFVDYGLPRRELYAPERCHGTMLCHYRHRAHEDPFLMPGLQDITAWVDFTAVAEAATASGFDLAGYTTQAHFLIANDIARLVAEGADAELPERLTLARQVRLLTLPGEMGERFKVIGFTRRYDAPLRGFAARDFSHQL
ncbi:MAG TPA: SAM-dependent methyltransferase, partial [Steroidobacteraceae bacterium]|nr:SAM-dependent methyltransferase [Steroidobacteraceae bacterium]